MAKILYMSCHSVLEFDEISLFTELGHEVFSMGAYQTSNSEGGLRSSIPNLYQNEHLRAISIKCSKENLHQELIDWADVIIMMHNARINIGDHPQPWVSNNWEKIKHKKVVWRSIGQSTREIEKSLAPFRKEGLKIIRYSPKEETIPSYAGSDAVIRFYKDPNEYKGWNGQNPRIVNLSQSLFGSKKTKGESGTPSRGDHMDIEVFKDVVKDFNWMVYGWGNEDAEEHNGGTLSHNDLKTMLQFNRCFFYVGTRPASYTLAFIEAMMSGMPIVSVGPDIGNSVYKEQKTFEAHEIIGENGVAGFWSDSVPELRSYCQRLLDDVELARRVGTEGRKRAIEFFGKDKVTEEWKKFFKTL